MKTNKALKIIEIETWETKLMIESKATNMREVFKRGRYISTEAFRR